MITVKHPTQGVVQFKDGTSEEEMARAMRTLDAPESSRETMPIRNPAPESISAVTGFTPSQAQSRADAGMERFTRVAAPAARYGIPLVAGLASAPLTAGASLPMTAATLSGIGSLSSMGGEMVAQGLEGRDDPRAVGAAGVYGATPVSQYGGFLARSALNIPSALFTNEVAKFIEAGGVDEYKENLGKENKLMRWGTPTLMAGGFSLLGGSAKRADMAEEARARISAERGSGGILMSEVFPELVEKEADALARGNSNARRAFESMGEDIGKTISIMYPEGSNMAPDVADRLRPMVGKLTDLQNKSRAAQEEATKAAVLADNAQRANSVEYPALMAKAREAAMEAVQQKALYNDGVTLLFGGSSDDIASLTTGRVMKDLTDAAKAAKSTANAAVGDLYNAVGIGPNDAVISQGALATAVKKHSGSGSMLEDNDLRAAFTEAVQPYIENGVIPRGRFQRMKADLAEALVRKGKDPIAANKLAAEQYNILREASDDYIKTARPDAYEGWIKANSAAAANFTARKTDAIDLISKGNIGGLLDRVIKEGFNGPLGKELLDYQTVLAKTFNPAKEGAEAAAAAAANGFMKNVNLALKGQLINKHIDRTSGHVEGFRNRDIEGLVKDMQTMASGGFPIEALGMGTPNQVASLAKIASAGKPGGLSVGELDSFFALMPKIGADKAAARIDYKRAMRDYLISEKFPNRQRETQALLAAQKRTGINAEIANKELAEAYKDPLVVFLNDNNAKLGSGPEENAKFINRLLTLEPEAAGRFVQVLKDSGRGAEAAKISTAAAATAVRQFGDFAKEGNDAANLSKIASFFYGDNSTDVMARKTLKSLMEPDAYDMMLKNIAFPIRQIVSSQRNLYRSTESTLMHNVRVKPFGASGGVFAMVGLDKILDLAKDSRYNQLYTVYINPKTAPIFKKYAFDVAKAVSQDAVARNALRLAVQDDEKAKTNP